MFKFKKKLSEKSLKKLHEIENSIDDGSLEEICEEIKEDKKKKNIEHNRRLENHLSNERAGNKSLYRNLGEPKWTNDYVSKFEIDGYKITACNQETRFVGHSYRIPTDKEMKQLEKLDLFFGLEDVFRENKYLARKFNYKSFCVDGVPNLEDLICK